MSKRWLLAIGVCALSVAVTRAQSPSPSPPLAQSNSPTTAGLDPAAATKAWLDSVPAEMRAKSDTYFEGGYWLILWNFLLNVAILLLLFETGISARLRDFAEKKTSSKSLQLLIFAVPLLLLAALLSFPLVVYQDFFREHTSGLSTQTFGAWFREQMMALAVSTFGLTILLVVIYAVIRRAPRTWWLWGTGVAIAFLMLVMMIAPVYIAPLFNTYKPLSDPAISQPILAMAQANEIPVHQVFQFDASRQSNRVSANVSGFLGTTRISLNDNLLKQCTLPEIRQVMAHEMGHYVLNHSLGLVIFNGMFALLAFAVARFVFDAVVRRRGERWGIRGISDPAGLPLLSLIFLTWRRETGVSYAASSAVHVLAAIAIALFFSVLKQHAPGLFEPGLHCPIAFALTTWAVFAIPVILDAAIFVRLHPLVILGQLLDWLTTSLLATVITAWWQRS